MQNGWIKIHRKLLKSAFYQRSSYVHLWVHLLLLANHEPKKLMWNGSVIVIKEGQFITGRKALAEDTGIPETTVERILDFLKKDGQIGQQKTSKYRLITIVNWRSYQEADNKRTTNGQQADTNKKYKNDKNIVVDLRSTTVGDDQEVVAVDEDGNPLPAKKKKDTPSYRSEVIRIATRFEADCLKQTGIKPTGNKGVYKMIESALTTHKLTEKNIYDLFDEWFSLGKSDEVTIDIMNALSRKNINGYRARNL